MAGDARPQSYRGLGGRIGGGRAGHALSPSYWRIEGRIEGGEQAMRGLNLIGGCKGVFGIV